MHTYFQYALLLASLAFLVQCDAQACSGDTPCGPGLQCCALQCYDTMKASCETNKQGKEVLCGFQHLPALTPDAVCGTTCYDTVDYGCCNSTEVLFQLGSESTCPSPAPTPTPGQNACNDNVLCESGLSCCNSMCYNTSLASCETSNTGVTVLCGFQHLPATTPDAACGTVCYDTITYGCCSDSQIYLLSMPSQCGSTSSPTTAAPSSSPTSSPTTTAPNANCGSAPCGTGLLCCNNQCYNPGQASCVTSNTGAIVLCGFQHLPLTTPDAACGTTCYDLEGYACCNESSVIYQTANQAANPCASFTNLVSCGGSFCMNGWGCCASSCYDASAFSCVTNGNNQQMICNNGDTACGSYCYSTSTATCCNDVIYGLGSSNLPVSCGGLANGGFEGNNGYNGYNGNGGYYYDPNGVYRECSQNGAASVSISFAVALVSLLVLA